ncbi:MAG: ACP S-malonyltransferase [Armatimonadota bacterium]
MGVLDSRKVALVFPGQGSQAVGMGKELAESFPTAAEIFERADRLLGFSISELCFDGPEAELTKTINTQPALFVTSVAAYESVVAAGVCAPLRAEGKAGLNPPTREQKRPARYAYTAGHSVGEYAALYAAGAFSFETGLGLVQKRAALMQEAAEKNPGTMAAVLGLAPEQVQQAAEQASEVGLVVAANFNSPIQTVISGDRAGVARASEIALQMGARKVVPLNVSGAFHSPLMQEAADRLADALADAEISDSVVPVVANYTADFETTAQQIRENLARQITGSVRWVESVRRLLDSGVDAFIELGSGSVLAGLIKRIAPDAAVWSVGDRASLDALLSE